MTFNMTEKTFTARFVETEPNLVLELTNTTDRTLNSVEVLTIFLKDEETPGGGPSRVHIKFGAVKSVRPKERVVLSHRTWVDGRPSDLHQNQLERLQVREGVIKPYVLDISWEDEEGRSQFLRIPVGH